MKILKILNYNMEPLIINNFKLLNIRKMETLTTITKEELNQLPVNELRKEASSLGIKNYIRLGQNELIEAILKEQSKLQLIEEQSKLQLIEEIDQKMDKVIAEKNDDLYKKVMSSLGGEYDSDLDDLLDEASFEVLKKTNSLFEKSEEVKEFNPYQLINEINSKKPERVLEKDAVNDTKRSDIFYIDPKLIKAESGFNTRIDYGDMDELVSSIIENGVRVPLRGYKEGDNYILVDGHRRFRAVTLALQNGIDIARVPFISEKKKSKEDRIFDILLLNDGKPLSPLELGETYLKLKKYGYSIAEISRKIGKSAKQITSMIGVAESSKEVKKVIQEGNISASLVAEIKKKVKDEDKVSEIVSTVSSIKKESGDKKGHKITKKDIDDLVHSKEEIKENKVYKHKEVIDLLKKQIDKCCENLPDELKETVMKTEIVL
jgi:ParB/RepB/Spo0J family partition protein